MNASAIDIYQSYLDTSTRLVIGGQAEAYCRHVQLPFVFRTGGGVEVIETAQDLAADILRTHDWLQNQAVSDYHRIARTARFLDADTIEGFHVTYALRGAFPVLDPYCSRAILRRADGIWRVSYAEHELADALYPGRNAKAQHNIFSPNWTRAPSPIAHDHCEALDIYTARITSFAEAASAADFDAWLAHYTLPHSVHYDHGDVHIASAEKAREFFDMLQATIRRCGADRFEVRPLSAIYLSDNRILGYHDALLTRDGETKFGPVKSRMVMTNDTGPWRCLSVANALSTIAYQEGSFEPSQDFPTMREIEKRMKK